MDFTRMPTGGFPNPDAKVMDELTLDTVLDAYRQTGLEVLIGGFREGNKACPLAAVVMAKAGPYGSVRFNLPGETGHYFHGFAKGFDGNLPEITTINSPFERPLSERSYHRGYAFGREVRAAIDAGALTKVPDFPPEVSTEVVTTSVG